MKNPDRIQHTTGALSYQNSQADSTGPAHQSGALTKAETVAADKEFVTLAAQFALLGHALHRQLAADGTQTYLAERLGLTIYLPSSAEARRFLEQIGGAHD